MTENHSPNKGAMKHKDANKKVNFTSGILAPLRWFAPSLEIKKACLA
jgi:hypothetical protein